jgi:hypothetical protein
MVPLIPEIDLINVTAQKFLAGKYMFTLMVLKKA